MSELIAGDVEFFIAAPNLPRAVAALRAEAPTADEAYGLYSWGQKVLEASEEQEPPEAIRRIFDRCGWKLQFDPDGNVVDMQLTDSGSVDPNTESYLHPLFYTLAPFVREGSRVQMQTEDGLYVVYHFHNGRCTFNTKMDQLPPYLDPSSEREVVIGLDLAERILDLSASRVKLPAMELAHYWRRS